jgi:uncharacterized membrane protein
VKIALLDSLVPALRGYLLSRMEEHRLKFAKIYVFGCCFTKNSLL